MGASIILPLMWYGIYEITNYFHKLSENALVMPALLAFCIPTFLGVLTTPTQFIIGLGPFNISTVWLIKLLLALAPFVIAVLYCRRKMA